jgi:hypothetical protein
VFTARYGMSAYMKQTNFVFKGLNRLNYLLRITLKLGCLQNVIKSFLCSCRGKGNI